MPSLQILCNLVESYGSRARTAALPAWRSVRWSSSSQSLHHHCTLYCKLGKKAGKMAMTSIKHANCNQQKYGRTTLAMLQYQKLTTLEKDLSCATRTRLPLARLSFKDPNRSSLVSRAICLSLACAPGRIYWKWSGNGMSVLVPHLAIRGFAVATLLKI